MAENKVEQPSEIGKAANRLMELRAEAEKRVSSASASEAHDQIAKHNEVIRNSIREMSDAIVDVLRPLLSIAVESKGVLVNINKAVHKSSAQIKNLGGTVETMGTNLGEKLDGLTGAQQDIIAAITKSGESTDEHLETIADSIEIMLTTINDLASTMKEREYQKRDEQEYAEHDRSLRARRQSRGTENAFVNRAENYGGEKDHKKGLLSKMTGAIGGITNWFSSFLGIGGAVGGGILGGTIGRLFAGAGAMFIGLAKFGIVGALAAIAATGLMAVIFQSKKRMEAKGVTDLSDQVVGIAQDLWTGLVEFARGAVGSVLSLLSRIPKVGGLFAKLEEEVNSMADWFTDFSKTNEAELAKAQERIKTVEEEMGKASDALEKTEEQLSTLYRQRRRAESEGNQERVTALNAEIGRMEDLRGQQRAEADRASEIYDRLAKKIAKEKFGGIGKMWSNYVVPAWDKLTEAASTMWKWMGESWTFLSKKWEGFTDFWKNLQDDATAKLNEIQTGLSNFFSKTLPETYQSIVDSMKSSLSGISDTIGKKISDLGSFLSETFLSIFDLSWWKEKLKSLSPTNWFKSPAPTTEQQPVAPSAPKTQVPFEQRLFEPIPSVKSPVEPEIKPSSFLRLDRSDIVPFNDNQPATPQVGDNLISLQRDPLRLDKRMGRIDDIMRAIASQRQNGMAKMLANVTNVVAPQSVSVVNNTHTTMAVSPRPISHSTLGTLTKASNWG